MAADADRRSPLTDGAWMLAIGLVALLLRVVAARQFASDPLGTFLWIDEQAYAVRARAILAGHILPARPFYQDPLYPYILAALMAVVGDSVAALRTALACLGAVTPVALFAAARLGLGRTEALIAGWVAVFYGPLIATDIGLEKEGLGALLAAVALTVTARGALRPSASEAAAGGFLWGLLALLRSNALVAGPVGAVWWLRGVVRCEARRWSPWLGLTFILSFGLALAPAIAINAIVSRSPELLLTTWQAGPNFYIGNGPEATGTLTEIPFVVAHPFFEADDYAREAERRTGRVLTPGGVSRYWLGAGLRQWRQAPGASLRLLAKKVYLLGNDHEIADNHDAQYLRLTAVPALGWGVVSFGWIGPLAALGLGRAPRDRTPFWWFLVASTAAGLGATAAFYVVGRYRIPWVPGLILLAAAGAVDVARRLAARAWTAAAWRIVLLGAPAAALALGPTPIAAEDRWGLALRRQFKASLYAGEVDQAVDALDDARALGTVPMKHVAKMMALGPEHDRMADILAGRSRTMTDLRRARWLRQIPEGRAESRRLLDSMLRANPDNAAALREWGCWWLGAADDPIARRRAAAALRRARGDISAAILLALVTSEALQQEKAVARPAEARRLRVAHAILGERR
jgi:hypothetical protein